MASPSIPSLTGPVRREGLQLPALIHRAGGSAGRRFLEFFTAQIRNAHTRRGYARAVASFFEWCEAHGLELAQVEPMVVAAYVEELGRRYSVPTVKQHLAALRVLFDYLVVGQLLPFNPAAAVRGPKHVVKTGKTPVLFAEEARALFDSIETSHVVGLRDRALLGVMTYSFARVGAVVKMRVKDCRSQGRRAWFRLHEKGGKWHEVPAHHLAAEYMDAYLEASRLREDRDGPLFRSTRGRSRRLSPRGMSAGDVLAMVKRRAREAGLPGEICCHSFRATGITNFLQNGGDLAVAQRIAAHESPRTTALYDRTQDELSLDEIERIHL